MGEDVNLHTRRGCIAAGHPVTAEAGAIALEAGGNAFDAALAALMAACVAEPVLASPGGGGFLLARPAGGDAKLFDFFVHTPVRKSPAAHAFEVVTDWGTAQQAFHIGLGSAATPGLVKGLFAVHRALARLPMTELAAPAVAAARRGVAVTPFQAYLMTLVAPIYLAHPSARALFAGPEGGPKRAGDPLRNPELGDLFEALAREGEGLFYSGAVAEAIAAQCRERGGHLTRADLERYRVAVRAPLRHRYRDAVLLTNPPPSAGGALIAFGLALLSRHDLKAMSFGSAAHVALLARAQAQTSLARAARGRLGEDAAAEMLAQEFIAQYAAALTAPPRSRGTTHISVIDAEGNAAAVTVSNGEGCGELVPGTGMMLNNMLGEDDVNPDGLVDWPEDQRLASMMAPSALERADGSLVVTGTGGSKRIRTAILQTVSNLVDFGMSAAEAVAAPRLHVEGDHVGFEAGLSDAARAALAEIFTTHTAWAERNMFFGGVHTVVRGPDGALQGVGDPRRDGICLGGQPG